MRINALFALATTVVLSGCGKQAEIAPPPPPAVTVYTVETQQIQPKAEFVGRAQASEDVVIKSRVEGPLLKRHFTEGEAVEAGALLFEIDPATYEAKLEQSKAQLTQAIAARDVAEINWKRGKQLAPDGMISGKDMDELTTNKLQTEAAVVQARAALESTSLQLEYTKIYAPISGRISRTLVSLGDLISSQTEMATLVQLDPMWVNFQASERAATQAHMIMQDGRADLPRMHELLVSLRLPNEQIYAETGVLDFVSNRIDSATGTLGLRATFDNPSQILLPGMFLTVILQSPNTEDAIVIPQAAVQEDQQGRFVMVVKSDNTVEKRIVQLGDRIEVNWEVDSGLELGERIVLDGLQKIRPGVTVTASEADVTPFTPAS
ncbi:efflux RND transporter periplasmic adaptor subunit [Paraferrimonas haliotis]|uniref:Hemolysin secretion protein D n=1 Tax=Paraferrimonas haliotis TaxID=2013866 RepID=A0AA37TNH9_9GAMM|nr:efflux RND transporter periplasmic adaptor subunit [Paraferrimonas haliotis]GLS82943.1 hemolysin secretion protein D [Paraferrimonas haliotis]